MQAEMNFAYTQLTRVVGFKRVRCAVCILEFSENYRRIWAAHLASPSLQSFWAADKVPRHKDRSAKKHQPFRHQTIVTKSATTSSETKFAAGTRCLATSAGPMSNWSNDCARNEIFRRLPPGPIAISPKKPWPPDCELSTAALKTG